MKLLLRNINVIILALVVAVSSVGISVNNVYCFHKKKNEYSISFISNAGFKKNCSCKEHEVKEKSSCCKAKKTSIKKKCCNSSSVQLILESDYEIQRNLSLVENPFVWIESGFPTFSLDLMDKNDFENEDYNLRPPPLITQDVPILFQSFLI